MSPRRWIAPVRPILSVLFLLIALPTSARSQEATPRGVAVVATHVVTTKLRTLNTLPLKRLITDIAGWDYVTQGLKGAPASPAFDEGQACVLIVADLSGGAKSWIDRVKQTDNAKGLQVRLVRQPGKPDLLPHLKIIFLFTNVVPSGVDLRHQTRLEGGMGTITTNLSPLASDAKSAYWPALGPDLRFKIRKGGGAKAPKDSKLRHEVWYPGNDALPDKIRTVAFPYDGLPYPRILTGKKGAVAKHVYAAHAPGQRSARALQIRTLPPIEATKGCRPPITFTFVLEAVPAGRRGRR